MAVAVTRGAENNLLQRARGCMLGSMVGDALGAAVEGFPREEIRRMAQERWGTNSIEGFIPAVHMGTFVPDGVAKYRPATGVKDAKFVPTGPTQNASVAAQCVRTGMYTDDTNACLAVASSLSECGRADSAHVARRCAEFCRDNEAFRGCPPTAKRVMQATLEGVPTAETGLPPYFPFPGGSFANGGAMRISPLAILYRNADAATLRQAVATAIYASHRHPEAVDFAVVQAAAVAYALQVEPCNFDAQVLLTDLGTRCETDAMRDVILATAASLLNFPEGGDEQEAMEKVVALKENCRPGSSMGFQLASVHMAPCVLWVACHHHSDARAAVKLAIDIGGDTDTTATMVGAIVGALHGEGWCQDWASELENGPHGRDFALSLAERLALLPPAPVILSP